MVDPLSHPRTFPVAFDYIRPARNVQDIPFTRQRGVSLIPADSAADAAGICASLTAEMVRPTVIKALADDRCSLPTIHLE